MDTDKNYAFRIAFFNSIGFILTTGGVTFVDSRLTSNFYGARNYPLGYWITLLGPVILTSTYLCIQKSRTRIKKMLYTFIILFVAWLISLPIFLPECPHVGIINWMALYTIVGLLSIWIRFEPVSRDYLTKSDIPWEIKVERLKEYITLWRTVTVSFAFGYLALLVPSMNGMWSVSEIYLSKKSDIFLVSNAAVLALIPFSIYVVVGIVYESFRKSQVAADLLLTIKK